MIKALSCVLLVTSSYHVAAQFNVRLNVHGNFTSGEMIRIAGTFNNWNTTDSSIHPTLINDSTFQFNLAGLTGIQQFKFTRGGWDKVESTSSGDDILNRTLTIKSDTTVSYNIAGWKDLFTTAPRVSTASNNVRVLDTAFRMTLLNRTRRIWIYLPSDYNKTTKRFPVIYMHDGQNLFDDSTAENREWGVDEILDSLAATGKPTAIVVGIDNGPERLKEYNPFTFESAEGEGDKYLEFIIKGVKPFIDKHYRTLASKESTVIAGSSMGGLISYYAALKYREVFGRAGIFSPAFYRSPQILKVTDSLAPASRGMFFFYMGEQEGDQAMDEMYTVIDKLGATSNALLYTVTDPYGRHNEDAWRKWFAEFYLWVTSNGLNHIIR